jgi:hypothetical protein
MSFVVNSDGHFALLDLAKFAVERNLPWAACVSHPRRRPRRLARYALYQCVDPWSVSEVNLKDTRHHGYRYFLRVPKLHGEVTIEHRGSLRTEPIAIDLILHDRTVIACFMHPPAIASAWLADFRRLRDHPRLARRPDMAPNLLHILKRNHWLLTLPSRSSGPHHFVQTLDTQGLLPDRIHWHHHSTLK